MLSKKFNSLNVFSIGIQEKLGIMNNGEVYAVFSYEAQQSDELSFEVNDQLIILRKGDDAEREWWWAKMKATGKEGYVPRNLLGVCTLYIVDNLSVCVFFFPVSCNKTRKVIFNTYLILIYFLHFMFIIFFFQIHFQLYARIPLQQPSE